MRMMKGQPFRHVPADYPPDDWKHPEPPPVFSEAFLYSEIGKGDARFVLGVAEEYEHIIQALGPDAVRAILDVHPALVQRLGTGAKVTEWLADARSEQDLDFATRFPVQVILDRDGAEAVWTILHLKYRTHYNPEESMGRDELRTYHQLTDALGEPARRQRQLEIDRLPEKLARQEARRLQRIAERRAAEATI